MAAQFIHLRAIDKNSKNWSTKVQTLAKMNPRVAASSPTTYQKLLLGDDKGDTMEAVIFNTDIDLFQNTFRVGKAYVITNAGVNPTNERFKNPLATCDYQLTISARTSVADAENDGTLCSLPTPHLFHRNEFIKEIGKGTKISTVCVIIAKRLPRRMFLKERQNTLYEYAAVDKNLKPFVVTIWQDTIPNEILDALNKIDELPVFMLMNFSVADFYGLCLTSNAHSLVLEKIDEATFHDMVTWRDANKDVISGLIQRGGLFEEKIVQGNDELMSIQQVLQSNKEGKYNIFVKGKLSDKKQKLYYVSCNRCNFGTTAPPNSEFICRNCPDTGVVVTSIAKPRFRCPLHVYDTTGEMEIIVFGNDVEMETIIGMSVTELYETYNTGTDMPLDLINARLNAMWLRARIRGIPIANQKIGHGLSYSVVYIKFYEGEYTKCLQMASDNDPESSAYDVAKIETNVELEPTAAFGKSCASISLPLTAETVKTVAEKNVELEPIINSTMSAALGKSCASNFTSLPVTDETVKTMADTEFQKRRRLMKHGKRVIYSDDEVDDDATATNDIWNLPMDNTQMNALLQTDNKDGYKGKLPTVSKNDAEAALAGLPKVSEDDYDSSDLTLAEIMKKKKTGVIHKGNKIQKKLQATESGKLKPKKVGKNKTPKHDEKLHLQEEDNNDPDESDGHGVRRSTRGRIIKKKKLD